MSFALSVRSLRHLARVHSDLIRVVVLGIQYSKHDFAVSEGLRMMDRQRELLAKGFSQTMNSKHLVQADGFGHAVDIVAVGDLNADGSIDAQDRALTWEPRIYTEISFAMRRAAEELGVRIRWGGEFKTRDGRPWFDGPHYELV